MIQSRKLLGSTLKRLGSFIASGVKCGEIRTNCQYAAVVPRTIDGRLSGDVTHRVAIHSVRNYALMAETLAQVAPPKKQTFKGIEERVLKAIRAWDRFPQDRSDKLNLDADFSKDLGMDSLDHVEMILAIEDEFKLEIDEESAEKFTTPRAIYDFMCDRFDVYD